MANIIKYYINISLDLYSNILQQENGKLNQDFMGNDKLKQKLCLWLI